MAWEFDAATVRELERLCEGGMEPAVRELLSGCAVADQPVEVELLPEEWSAWSRRQAMADWREIRGGFEVD